MKFLIRIELTEEVEAPSADDAKFQFLKEIEEESNQPLASWLYDQLTVKEMVEDDIYR